MGCSGGSRYWCGDSLCSGTAPQGKEEEARQRAEAQREAARRNAAEEARKAQAYLLAQIVAQQAALEQTVSHRGQDTKIERMEEAEGATLAAARTARSQRDEQAYQDYRAGERNAEAITAEYQARKAVQEYRQGERAEYITPIEPSVPICTPTVFDRPKPWWVPSFSVQEAVELVHIIPSVEVASNRIPVPVAKIVAPGRMISFGTVTAWSLGSNANPGAELRTDGFGGGTINEPDKPSAFARVNLDTAEISGSIRLPGGLGFTQDGFSSSLGYSINAYAQWDGWNTTVSIDLNYADVETSGAGMKGNISKGMYVEVKPLQVATVVVGVTLLVSAAVAFGPEIGAALGILGETGSRLLPQFLR